MSDSTPRDGRLDEVLADARLLLDEQLSRARPLPDLQDVLERAEALGDGELELELAGEGEADVESLWARSQAPLDDRDELLDPILDQINADARLLLDAMLDGSTRSGQARAGRLDQRRRSPRRVAAAAAALLIAGLGGAALANNWRQARLDAAEAERFAAESAAAAASAFAAASLEDPGAQLEQYPSYFVPDSRAPAAASGVVEDAPGRDEPVASSEDAARQDRLDRLEQLDAEAYALLRAGQREAARAKFERIVQIGGRSEYAELAYGELFALARGPGDGGLDELWRSYLKRFPSGRYADAAQAGLCRRAKDPDEQRTCWTKYLELHPRGVARKEALGHTGG